VSVLGRTREKDCFLFLLLYSSIAQCIVKHPSLLFSSMHLQCYYSLSLSFLCSYNYYYYYYKCFFLNTFFYKIFCVALSLSFCYIIHSNSPCSHHSESMYILNLSVCLSTSLFLSLDSETGL